MSPQRQDRKTHEYGSCAVEGVIYSRNFFTSVTSNGVWGMVLEGFCV